MQSRRQFFTSTLALGAALAATGAWAAQPKTYQSGGVAIGGTDPVAYFTEGKPVKGAAKHSLSWNGATWHFASAGNMAKFETDPAAYAPQFGGYCAYAVSKGYTASTVPAAWHIHEGKLYLNYSKSVRLLWRADMTSNIAKANANWPNVLNT